MALLDAYTKYARYRQMKSNLTAILGDTSPDGLTCLNAGGGYGHAHEALTNMGFTVTTGDIEPAQQADCILLDLEKPLPFADNAFDVVVCLAVLEHLDNWQQALRELQRVAKRGVLATTPSVYGKPVLDTLAALNLVNPEHIADHKYYLTKDDITREGYGHQYFQGGLNQVLFYKKHVA